MNSDLYNKRIPIPEDVTRYLEQCFNSTKNVPETTEGYKRNQDLRSNSEISYQQLKRMKNWFDNFKGHNNEPSFVLNGGHYVKNWVNQTLGSMRDGVKQSKETKSTVLPNQFKKETDDINLSDMNRPSKSHSKTSDIYNKQITENLKRINEIIKKIM